MIYLFALIIAALIGTLTLRLIVKDKISLELSILLGIALGFGIVGQMIFYIQLISNQFNHFLIPLISLTLVGVLFWLNKKDINKIGDSALFSNTISRNRALSPILILVLAVPLWLEASHYPMGGWDAWSCWNLKAKFIYFGEERWKDLFDPVLWRSNTGYPLSLPTINVWFWQWGGFSQNTTMLNAIVLTLATAGVLLFGLQALNVPVIPALLITLSIFTLAFGNTLCISQYSDILFSLDLLCVFVCFLLFQKTKDNGYLILTAIFIGLLAFTKNEGLASFVILTVLILLQRPKNSLNFLGVVILAALPMIIFTLFMAPHSQAFVNGFLSSEHPSTFSRMISIIKNTVLELLSPNWMGLWILAGIGLFLSKEKAFKSPLVIIGLFTASYFLVILGYYQVNTFFDDINWWMNSSLNRIVFALMPSIFLWVGISLFGSAQKKKN